jgi:hypothetical protein
MTATLGCVLLALLADLALILVTRAITPWLRRRSA